MENGKWKMENEKWKMKNSLSLLPLRSSAPLPLRSSAPLPLRSSAPLPLSSSAPPLLRASITDTCPDKLSQVSALYRSHLVVKLSESPEQPDGG